MPTYPEPEVIERALEEEFLDILCADTELLRVEFDAIIAAEWPDPPPPETRRELVSRGSGREYPRRWSADPLTHSVQCRPLGRDAWRRQRSPPGRDSLPTTEKGR